MNEFSKELCHHGIIGQKWGIRRFQPYPKGHNSDGKFVGAIKSSIQKAKDRKATRKANWKSFNDAHKQAVEYKSSKKAVEYLDTLIEKQKAKYTKKPKESLKNEITINTQIRNALDKNAKEKFKGLEEKLAKGARDYPRSSAIQYASFIGKDDAKNVKKMLSRSFAVNPPSLVNSIKHELKKKGLLGDVSKHVDKIMSQSVSMAQQQAIHNLQLQQNIQNQINTQNFMMQQINQATQQASMMAMNNAMSASMNAAMNASISASMGPGTYVHSTFM